MRVKILGIAAATALLFVGTAHAHRHHHHGGYYRPWYGPSYWGPPPVSIGLGPVGIGFGSPYYYYDPVPVIINQPPVVSKNVFYRPVQNSALMKAQAQLSSLGYYKGVIDGSYGPITKKAIETFQSENGLPVTGRLDSQTLQRLK